MRLKSALRRGVAAAVIAGIVVSSGIPAYADRWDIVKGNITVEAGDTEGTNKVSQGKTIDQDDTDTVITGESKEHTVTIDTSGGKVDVTFNDLKIDVSGKAEVDGSGDGVDARSELVPDASSRAGGMIPPSRPRQTLAGHRQAETATRPVNPAALGAGTRDAETDLRTITKNHR